MSEDKPKKEFKQRIIKFDTKHHCGYYVASNVDEYDAILRDVLESLIDMHYLDDEVKNPGQIDMFDPTKGISVRQHALNALTHECPRHSRYYVRQFMAGWGGDGVDFIDVIYPDKAKPLD